ncbi:MAG: alpha/beta fold hydrolase [Bacteroidota bacterium]
MPQKKSYLRLIIVSIIVVNLSISCDSDDESLIDDNPVIEEKLVSTDLVTTTPSSTLQLALIFADINLDPQEFQYAVDLYRITYRTNYKGEEITASGLIAIPQTDDQLDVISVHHGTIGSDAEAPSNLATTDSFVFLIQAVASAGFVAIAPDFIGFGSSSEIMHPYYVEALTATSILDNITAGLEFADQLELNVNQNLFLAGYSQGGYATMAAHKYIEENNLTDFGLIASFPASGGYDLKGFQEIIFDLETYHQPFYLAYISHAYQTAFDFSQPLSLLFNEPYASDIPTLFDGSNTGEQINEQLTDDLSELLTTGFLNGIDTDTEYQFIANALVENSLLNWTPTIPLYMYHGDADITVPYQTSVDTYNKLIENGASAEIISFTNLEDKNHSTGLIPYIEQFVPVLLDLR